MNAIKYIFWEGSDGKRNGIMAIGFIVWMVVLIGYLMPSINQLEDDTIHKLYDIGCVELKERIIFQNWEGFHEPHALKHAERIYEWSCEKS